LLIRSVHAGDYVGCTRIVRARSHDMQPALPFERVCVDAIDRSIVDPAILDDENHEHSSESEAAVPATVPDHR